MRHAYGVASDIPQLLRKLETAPLSETDSDTWFSLWSALAHQGDIYPASFAAVPHIVRMLAVAPQEASHDFFSFPAWIEICRQKQAVEIPEDLAGDYFDALAQLPSLVAAAADREWDTYLVRATLSAIAAVKGFGAIAELIQELEPASVAALLKWLENQ